jgi:two-component system, NtrC family, sensor kinase
MKSILIVFFSLFLTMQVRTQPFKVDSLRNKIEASKVDTNLVRMLGDLSTYYVHNRLDSGIYYVQRMIKISQKLKYPYGEAWGLSILSTAADRTFDFIKALQIAQSCLHFSEKLSYGRDEMIARAYTQMGTLNFLTGHYTEARLYLHQALYFAGRNYSNEASYYQIYAHLGNAFRRQALSDTSVTLRQKLLDSAEYFINKAYALSKNSNGDLFHPYVLNCEGELNQALGKTEIAKRFYREAIIQGIRINHLFQLSYSYSQMSKLFNKSGELDSSIFYAKKSLKLSQDKYYSFFIPFAAEQLSVAFEKINQPDSALKYMKIAMDVREKEMNQSKQQQFQLLDFEEQQRQEKAELAEQQYRVRARTFLLIGGLIVLALLLSLLYRNNRNKQKSNRQLTAKATELEKTMLNLRETQAQLIQSEKMASLGELTAGIAHEIQNPLNFVNNFSEVSNELIDEMMTELSIGNQREAVEIADNVRQNLKKIMHHGKRADAIVKGMLQHSRSGLGVKEPTDINALCNEYLRLSYHGFRGKEKLFNAELRADFEESIGKINIIPQDIGRVLLNLYNNAFYAVWAKKQQKPEGYEPAVSVTTKKVDGKAEIRVKDNGNGVPEKVKEKIFQPFFTTKPTGQGTGLGLSLCFDIIKAHGGEITVETKEGRFTEFVIQIPEV